LYYEFHPWRHEESSIDVGEARSIFESEALRSLRQPIRDARLGAFAEDWDWPEMAAFDELPPR